MTQHSGSNDRRATRWLLGAGFVDFLGAGLFVAFSAIYFTQAVGLPISRVGLGIGIAGCAAMVAAVPLGRAADRHGVRRALVLAIAFDSGRRLPEGHRPPHVACGVMEENRARRVVDALRDRGIDAHLLRAGVDEFGVRIPLSGGRSAEWDTDGTAGLEAQVMRDGMLVGFVPVIEGSEDYDEQQVVDAIARTDYDQPVARQRPAAPPPAPPLTREGGVFRRFLDGFRYR